MPSWSYDTVTSTSIFRALNAPGGVVHTELVRYGAEAVRVGRKNSPIGNALDYGTFPRAPGRYRMGWEWWHSGTNQHGVRIRIGNKAPYAIVIEQGRRRTRKRQRFTWRRAQPTPGSWVSTPVVRAWRSKRGYRLVERVTRAVAKRRGLT